MRQFFYADLSESEKKQYCQDILQLINPYLAARAAKFKQFSEQVIQYIKDASLPHDKEEEDMVATFNNLTKNERAVLSQKIIQLVSVEGYKAYILSFFINNASNERAKKFIDNNPSGEYKSARENVLGCTML